MYGGGEWREVHSVERRDRYCVWYQLGTEIKRVRWAGSGEKCIVWSVVIGTASDISWVLK